MAGLHGIPGPVPSGHPAMTASKCPRAAHLSLCRCASDGANLSRRIVVALDSSSRNYKLRRTEFCCRLPLDGSPLMTDLVLKPGLCFAGLYDLEGLVSVDPPFVAHLAP